MTQGFGRSSMSTPPVRADAAACADRDRPETTQSAVVCFTLPSNGERWNWPVEGWDAIDALAEILDRANIPWRVRLTVEPKP